MAERKMDTNSVYGSFINAFAKEFRNVKTLFPVLRVYPWGLPALVGLGLLSSLAEGIGIGLFIPLLHNLKPTHTAVQTGNWLVDGFRQVFNGVAPAQRQSIIALCLFASIFLKAALAYSNKMVFDWLDVHIGHRLRCGIFEQLLTVSYRFLENSESGRLLNALTTETWRTSDALGILVHIIITLCTLMVYTALLLFISWKLTLVVTVISLLISLLVYHLTRRARSLGERVTGINAVLANRMVEGIEGMKVIRAFGRESFEKERFQHVSGLLSNVLIKLELIAGMVSPIYEILAAALMVTLFLLSMRHPADIPVLLVFLFVLYRLQPKIKQLDEARVSLASLSAAAQEVISLLDTSDKPYIRSGTTPYRGLQHAIAFDHVTFRYNPADKPALQNVSITIPAGKITAIVGPSGAGKSTLIKLLLRLYDVTEGCIYLDHCPLPDVLLAAWRQRVACVSQDVFMFNATVRENIAYGRLEATDAEIIAAAKQAAAHDFIVALPEGYDTRVGDHGVRLSGGQQQRIALARAIVRAPEILILDEATNALDSISERLIQEALDTLSQTCTVIVIAHRLSTIDQADHIVVLREGCVHEQGALQQLLQRDGLFAELYRL